VALTKRDLVDEEWAALARADVGAALQGTPLAGTPMIEVSATAKTGLNELVASLDSVLRTAEARRDVGRPRLGIDRAFTLTGFGTVVTGTLVDGALATGDEIEILPRGQRARIRGIQTHKRALDSATRARNGRRPTRHAGAGFGGVRAHRGPELGLRGHDP